MTPAVVDPDVTLLGGEGELKKIKSPIF